jgi:hypothetical protein
VEDLGGVEDLVVLEVEDLVEEAQEGTFRFYIH